MKPHERLLGPERVAVEASGLEERARPIVVQVEWVLYEPEHLHILGDPIGAVKVYNPIRWYLRILVGIIVDQVLAVEDKEIATQLPGIRDLVLGRQLEALIRNRRNMLTRVTKIFPLTDLLRRVCRLPPRP